MYFGSLYGVHQNHLPWTIDVSYRSLVFQNAGFGYLAGSLEATLGHSAATKATSNSFHQQNRVSYGSDDAVLELPFPWFLCYIALTPALQEPERKLVQPNIAELIPKTQVCKMFMLVAVGRCDRPLAADRRVPLRTRHHDKSFFRSALLASGMHELLLDMVHSGWSIV